MADSSEIVEFLSRPATYGGGTAAVELIETHISWVFLTASRVYKLKKPVRFEFVDFSRPELRQAACEEELRLNRRLARDVYLAVLPIICDEDGELSLGGEGPTVDWVVEMRRLPAERALDVVLREGRLRSEDAGRVAECLVAFYAGLPAEAITAEVYRGAIRRHIEANREALLSLLPAAQHAAIRRAIGAQLRFLALQAAVFDERVRAGRVMDGHGDLRPEHIYLTEPPAVIDCIEFSAELRRVDVADELSFLAMECERLGRRDVGELVFATFQRASGDEVPPSLLDFYQSYRACVRAKVWALRAQQERDVIANSLDIAQQYVALAERHAGALGAPALVVVGGLMGTGKSTLAGKLATSIGAELLATDRMRREMLGASESPAEYGEGRYRPELRRQVYGELYRRAGQLLEIGLSVVLDGTFLTNELRRAAIELARRHGAVPLVVMCQCSRETALRRIAKRADAGGGESEARAELYDAQAREYEAPAAEDGVVLVNSETPATEQLRVAWDALRRRAL